MFSSNRRNKLFCDKSNLLMKSKAVEIAREVSDSWWHLVRFPNWLPKVKKIHMFIQNWRRKCTKANLYDYRGTNPNHDRKKGLRIRFGGLKINNCLAFKCCITLKEKCDFKLLTFGFVNKLSELADSNFCWNRFLTKLSEHTTYQLKYNASSFHPQILCWKC